jgi:hypothetical protein
MLKYEHATLYFQFTSGIDRHATRARKSRVSRCIVEPDPGERQEPLLIILDQKKKVSSVFLQSITHSLKTA